MGIIVDASQPYARNVNLLLAEAKNKVSKGSDRQGFLQIGSLDSTAAIRLSPLLVRFSLAYPDVDLTLVTGTGSFLSSEVLHRRLDGAFVVGPVRHPDLEERQVWVEEIALYTPPRFRTLESLARYENLKVLVFRLGCSYRQRLEQFLQKRGMLGMKFLEFGSFDGIFGCVAAGLGITLFPVAFSQMPSWKAQWKDKINVHRLPKGESKAPTVFVRRRDGFVSDPLTHFLDAIKET
jgi:DNA-binding transcriptional LysR family regulator